MIKTVCIYDRSELILYSMPSFFLHRDIRQYWYKYANTRPIDTQVCHFPIPAFGS